MTGEAHDPLAAIIEAIERIEILTAGKTFDIYQDDWALRLAVERAIEIISEASRRIPPGLREQRPEIDWSKIFGIGNILRHDYHKIVDRVIFEVATERMRDLKTVVLAIAASVSETDK